MNRILITTLVILLGSATTLRAADDKAEGIAWHDDFDKAMALAAKDGKPLIAYFTFDTCFWCKKLEKACYFDADVVKQSKNFVWVKVDRDKTPEIPKEFNVSAYPSLLTLGTKKENIYRFQGFHEKPEFTAQLDKAQKRYDLYKNGKDWDGKESRPAKITEEGTIETIKAASSDVATGIVSLGDFLWVAHMSKTGATRLYKLDAKGKIDATYELKEYLNGLCTDGKDLYGVSSSWTAGGPIVRIDPATGKVAATIVTEANKKNKHYGANGIAWRDGKLYVLEGLNGVINEVDPKDGTVGQEINLKTPWLVGLAFDGKHFVVGSKTHLMFFDPEKNELVRKVAVNYPLRGIGVKDDAYYLMEQPTFGFGRKHETIQIWPKETVVYKLTLGKKD